MNYKYILGGRTLSESQLKGLFELLNSGPTSRPRLELIKADADKYFATSTDSIYTSSIYSGLTIIK